MKEVSIPVKRPSKTRDALQIIDRMIGNDQALRRLAIEAEVNAHIAQIIYDARTAAGLTRAQLAQLIGTKEAVIVRLEDADYRGHSLSMLQRIAEALNQRLELRLVPSAGPLPTNASQPRLRA